eukprot:851656-Pelagomonas_calceolata.AAC.4
MVCLMASRERDGLVEMVRLMASREDVRHDVVRGRRHSAVRRKAMRHYMTFKGQRLGGHVGRSGVRVKSRGGSLGQRRTVVLICPWPQVSEVRFCRWARGCCTLRRWAVREGVGAAAREEGLADAALSALRYAAGEDAVVGTWRWEAAGFRADPAWRKFEAGGHAVAAAAAVAGAAAATGAGLVAVLPLFEGLCWVPCDGAAELETEVGEDVRTGGVFRSDSWAWRALGGGAAAV